MIKGTTSNGFQFEIDERRVNDYDFIRILAHLQSAPEDAQAKLDFFEGLRTIVIGEELEKQLVTHIRETMGYADADVVAENMGEIYRIARDAMDEQKRKNLTSSSGVLHSTRMPSSVTSQRPTEYTIINQSQPKPSESCVMGYLSQVESRLS